MLTEMKSMINNELTICIHLIPNGLLVSVPIDVMHILLFGEKSILTHVEEICSSCTELQKMIIEQQQQEEEEE